jgi:hypothetical protein
MENYVDVGVNETTNNFVIKMTGQTDIHINYQNDLNLQLLSETAVFQDQIYERYDLTTDDPLIKNFESSCQVLGFSDCQKDGASMELLKNLLPKLFSSLKTHNIYNKNAGQEQDLINSFVNNKDNLFRFINKLIYYCIYEEGTIQAHTLPRIKNASENELFVAEPLPEFSLPILLSFDFGCNPLHYTTTIKIIDTVVKRYIDPSTKKKTDMSFPLRGHSIRLQGPVFKKIGYTNHCLLTSKTCNQPQLDFEYNLDIGLNSNGQNRQIKNYKRTTDQACKNPVKTDPNQKIIFIGNNEKNEKLINSSITEEEKIALILAKSFGDRLQVFMMFVLNSILQKNSNYFGGEIQWKEAGISTGDKVVLLFCILFKIPCFYFSAGRINKKGENFDRINNVLFYRHNSTVQKGTTDYIKYRIEWLKSIKLRFIQLNYENVVLHYTSYIKILEELKNNKTHIFGFEDTDISLRLAERGVILSSEFYDKLIDFIIKNLENFDDNFLSLTTEFKAFDPNSQDEDQIKSNIEIEFKKIEKILEDAKCKRIIDKRIDKYVFIRTIQLNNIKKPTKTTKNANIDVPKNYFFIDPDDFDSSIKNSKEMSSYYHFAKNKILPQHTSKGGSSSKKSHSYVPQKWVNLILKYTDNKDENKIKEFIRDKIDTSDVEYAHKPGKVYDEDGKKIDYPLENFDANFELVREILVYYQEQKEASPFKEAVNDFFEDFGHVYEEAFRSFRLHQGMNYASPLLRITLFAIRFKYDRRYFDWDNPAQMEIYDKYVRGGINKIRQENQKDDFKALPVYLRADEYAESLANETESWYKSFLQDRIEESKSQKTTTKQWSKKFGIMITTGLPKRTAITVGAKGGSYRIRRPRRTHIRRNKRVSRKTHRRPKRTTRKR